MRITELINRGEFVVTAEFGPPKGINVDHLLRTAEQYFEGVAAINVTDCQGSVMRMGALATCKALKDNGHNPILQIVCRDKSRLALQSEMLSAAFFGIDNLLLLTGDHPRLGDNPQSKPVFDLDSVSLMHAAVQIENGFDLAGNALESEPPKFAKGAVVSPCSDSVDLQLIKMERKVMAGAEFFQTQAVYEPEKFIRFMEKARQFNVPVILGVISPRSVGMVNYMNDNIAGISVPQDLIDELKSDKEKTKAGITGVEITARIIKECKQYCQGVHIMALGDGSKVPSILKLAGIK